MADAKTLLESLSWKEDTVVTNPFGERVWLKETFDADGKRRGITDCCPEDDPCDWHKAIKNA